MEFNAMAPTQWSTPEIKTLFSNVLGETEKLGIPMKYLLECEGETIAEWCEDLRPGRLGRIASKALINEPLIDELLGMFDYNPETGSLVWKISVPTIKSRLATKLDASSMSPKMARQYSSNAKSNEKSRLLREGT